MSSDNTRASGDRPVERNIVSVTSVPSAPAPGMFADLPVGPLSSPLAVPMGGRSVMAAAAKFHKSIVVVALLVAGVVMAGVWMVFVPQYRAGAEIRVRPIIPRLVYRTDENGAIPLYESFVNTQAAVVSSPTVLQRALEQPQVQATEWYQNHDSGWLKFIRHDDRAAIERLREALKVRPRGRTEIIDVSMSAPSAADAKVIVDAVLDQYTAYLRESSDRTSDVMYRQLLAQYSRLRDDIEMREGAVGRLMKEFGSDTPEELISRKRRRLDAIEAEMADVQRQLATGQWQENEWQGMLQRETQAALVSETQPTALAIKPYYWADLEWRQRHMAVKSVQHQREVELQQLGAEHPRMVSLDKEILFAVASRRARESQLDRQWRLHRGETPSEIRQAPSISNELAAIRQTAKLLRFRQTLLAGDLATQHADWERTLDNAMTLARQKQILTRKRELFADVRQRKEARETERSVPGSIEVLTRAFAPAAPARDLRLLGSVGAVCLGMVCGIAFAVTKAGRNQAICGVRELHHHVAGPFLGHLPLLGPKDAATPETSEPVNEGIRMVRTSLMAHMENDEGNSVLVTSAGRGEGKSTVARLLARSMARCNLKVLLVDADLRTREASVRLGMTYNDGLVSILNGSLSDAETIVATDIPNLSILPAGDVQGELDPEILANGALAACMERWRNTYDIVLLDSPPLLTVADARILAKHIDGVVLVVREEMSLRHDVTDALRSLHASGGTLWGTVFVGALRRMSYGCNQDDRA